MVIQIVIYLLILLAWILYFYTVYKVIWYIIKMFSFRAKMRKLGKEDGIYVEELRGLKGILFGTKGEADYYVTVKGKRYEVSVISFISVHGRWSFEKNPHGASDRGASSSRVLLLQETPLECGRLSP